MLKPSLLLTLPLFLAACTVDKTAPAPTTGDPLNLTLSGTVKDGTADVAGQTVSLISTTFDPTGTTGTKINTLASATVTAGGSFSMTASQANIDAELKAVTAPSPADNCTGPVTYSVPAGFKIIERANLTLTASDGTVKDLFVRPAGAPAPTMADVYLFDYANGTATITLDQTCTFPTSPTTTGSVHTKTNVTYHKGWNLHHAVFGGTAENRTYTFTDAALPVSYTLETMDTASVGGQSLHSIVPSLFGR